MNIFFSEKIQSAMIVLLNILTVPVFILNLGGVVVSGIWLSILGEWLPILQGIGFMMVAWLVLGFALMPSLIFAIPAASLVEKGRKALGLLVGSFSVLYTNALITIWCIWILTLFMEQASQSSFIPMLIWSYGVALAPWLNMAQEEQYNEYSAFTAFTASIAYVVAMLMLVFGATGLAIVITFGSIMLISAILQTLLAFAEERQQGYPTFHYEQELFKEETKDESYLPESNSTQNYCAHCGAKIKKGGSFCSQCGKRTKT